MKKRIASLIVALALVLTVLPVQVFAAAGETIDVTFSADKTRIFPGEPLQVQVTLGAISQLSSVDMELKVPLGMKMENLAFTPQANKLFASAITKAQGRFINVSAQKTDFVLSEPLPFVTFVCQTNNIAGGDYELSCRKEPFDFAQNRGWDDVPANITPLSVHVHDMVTVPAVEATCTREGHIQHEKCTICGRMYDRAHQELTAEQVTIPMKPHVYDQQVVSDKYLKTPATETSPAVYYKSCICGAKGTETFVDDQGHAQEGTIDVKFTADHAQVFPGEPVQAGVTITTDSPLASIDMQLELPQGMKMENLAFTPEAEKLFSTGYHKIVNQSVYVSAKGTDYTIPVNMPLLTFTCNTQGAPGGDYELTYQTEKADFTTDRGRVNVAANVVSAPLHIHQLETVEAVEATCTSTGTIRHEKCTLCGKRYDENHRELTEQETIIPMKPHVYDRMVIAPQYLKTPATADSPAVYYKSCVCGAKGTETFVDDGKPHTPAGTIDVILTADSMSLFPGDTVRGKILLNTESKVSSIDMKLEVPQGLTLTGMTFTPEAENLFTGYHKIVNNAIYMSAKETDCLLPNQFPLVTFECSTNGITPGEYTIEYHNDPSDFTTERGRKNIPANVVPVTVHVHDVTEVESEGKIYYYCRSCGKYYDADHNEVTGPDLPPQQGVTVSGTVKALGTEGPVTVELWQNGQMVTSVQSDSTGHYTLENVMPGDYEIHYAQQDLVTRQEPLAVGDSPVSLPETQIRRFGDVSGDGRIKANDAAMLFKNLGNFSDSYDIKTYDISGDGRIKANDAAMLFKNLGNF